MKNYRGTHSPKNPSNSAWRWLNMVTGEYGEIGFICTGSKTANGDITPDTRRSEHDLVSRMMTASMLYARFAFYVILQDGGTERRRTPNANGFMWKSVTCYVLPLTGTPPRYWLPYLPSLSTDLTFSFSHVNDLSTAASANSLFFFFFLPPLYRLKTISGWCGFAFVTRLTKLRFERISHLCTKMCYVSR